MKSTCDAFVIRVACFKFLVAMTFRKLIFRSKRSRHAKFQNPLKFIREKVLSAKSDLFLHQPVSAAKLLFNFKQHSRAQCHQTFPYLVPSVSCFHEATAVFFPTPCFYVSFGRLGMFVFFLLGVCSNVGCLAELKCLAEPPHSTNPNFYGTE